jgi:lactate permease
LSFAVTQYFTSNFIGPELPDITSALASLISLTLFLKVWQPKRAAGQHMPAPSRRRGHRQRGGGQRTTVASPYSLARSSRPGRRS